MHSETVKNSLSNQNIEENEEHSKFLRDKQNQRKGQPVQVMPKQVHSNRVILRKLILIAFVITIILSFVSQFTDRKTAKIVQTMQLEIAKLTKIRFPKILWIYTENQREAQPLQNDIFINYIENIAEKLNYEINYVNSWNSYDWLSKETISKISETMQKSTIDETVHSLLKLGLLMQKGGIMIHPGTVMSGDSWSWIEQMFDAYQGNWNNLYLCKPEETFVFMPKIQSSSGKYKFSKEVIASVPKSTLLKEAFNLLCQTILGDKMLLIKLQKVLLWNEDTGIHYLRDSLQDSINLAFDQKKKILQQKKNETDCISGMQQTFYGVAKLQESDWIHSLRIGMHQRGVERLMSLKGIKNKQNLKIIMGLNQKPVLEYVEKLFVKEQKILELQKNSLVYSILSANENKQLFFQELPKRQIQLCIVLMESLSGQQITQTATTFDNQTYQKWKLVIPAKDIRNTPKIKDSRIVIMQSKSNKVHNIEKAVAKYCQPKGYAILLNYGQKFNDQNVLSEIAKATQQRDVVGIFIALQHQGKVYQPKKQFSRFDRDIDGIVNPKLEVMNHFLNHFRIFAIQTFRLIPQFAMRNMYGQYYKDRCIFLMDLIQQLKQKIEEPRQLYFVKKFAHLWNVPNRINLINKSFRIIITQFEEVDLQQLKVTRTRLSCLHARQQLSSILQWKIPFQKLLAFNNGDDFVSIEQKQGPQKIPRIIHQVWLGTNDLPPAKQYFYQKTKRIYPNYEIKLWRQKNITKQMFPYTFDILNTLIAFNKHSPYNKLATVTDILRHEILYHEGGFWKDAGMNMLRPILDKFLKYKLVLPVDRIFKYRYLQGMCFFGNAPKYQNLMRINSYQNINRMRIYQKDPLTIAGPVDFRQLLIGQEQYDPEILLLPYETFYPGQVGQHPENDLCTKRRKNMRRGDRYQIIEDGWFLLSNCADLYPYAFAIEHNNYGSTWQKRRSI